MPLYFQVFKGYSTIETAIALIPHIFERLTFKYLCS
ncbi:hypothetical protein SS7213T_03190, partial [Staphylococcus simiae CCM 7213 = CCUG 51256]